MSERTANPRPAVVRPFPYPYRSLLAICSDLDETPDRSVYWESMRFLNTTETTAMGRGVGLEVGNTIYFDMAPGQFAYWNTNDRGRAEVRALIQSGHIDCLHSFGDLAIGRAHASRALDELARHDCRIKVWIDHAVAATNFGADIMRGEGDLPGATAFHADLTWDFGVRFVWRGRVTSVIGQDAPHSLARIFAVRHPSASGTTVAKELAKRLLGAGGAAKYRMNAENRLLRPATLRSGHAVHEFLRSNPSWGGVSCFDTADGLAEVLTPGFLRQLARREACCVLYTHMGKVTSATEPFGTATRAGLRRLADAEQRGDILTTTTRRLLDYRHHLAAAQAVLSTGADGAIIDVAGAVDGTPLDVNALAGFTVYVDDATRVAMRINGVAVATLTRNAADATGRPSVSVPWHRLPFPQL